MRAGSNMGPGGQGDAVRLKPAQIWGPEVKVDAGRLKYGDRRSR